MVAAPMRPYHVALTAALALAGVAAGAPVANERCPVEPGELAVERHQTTYRGAVVSFCCADCVDEFEADPEQFLDQLPEMHFDPPEPGRSAFQQRVDAVWNAAVATPGITLGTLALLALGGLRLAASKLPRDSAAARCARRATGRAGVATLALVALGGEALAAHLAHRRTRESIAESELEHEVHYAVFQEYGDPPTPSRPDRDPALRSVFYRGNDERNPALFNGGHYRTTTFHLGVCDRDGRPLDHGDRAEGADLFLHVELERAPGTPDYFWEPDRMASIYATRDPGKFHGRFAPVGDATPMVETEPMQRWEFRYPLAPFARGQGGSAYRGIVYLCEARTDKRGRTIGGRFHYAFQFEIRLQDGRISPVSDLWMGALYRKRSLRIWEIPEREWLSTEPIPVVEGGQATDDPKLLGIEAYEKDLN